MALDVKGSSVSKQMSINSRRVFPDRGTAVFKNLDYRSRTGRVVSGSDRSSFSSQDVIQI